ncbi:MAG: 4Fe-4S cluster-binding domain-containing protein [Clostridia bacterium]|nr:4Fe-4S cluster-binding domain-containing protein [Clostridia bacterium]
MIVNTEKDSIKPLHFFECFGDFFVLDTASIRLFNVDYKTWRELKDVVCGGNVHSEVYRLFEQANYTEIQIPSDSQAENTNNATNAYSICFILTHACNLNCIYCFDKEQRKSNAGTGLDFNAAKKAIEDVMAKYKKITLWFFGGEPLLKFGLIRDIVAFCEDMRIQRKEFEFRYTITTNGTLINEEVLEFFSKHRFSMLVSHDGSDEILDRQRPRGGHIQNSSSDIRRGLEMAVEYRDRLSSMAVRSTITRNTLALLPEIFFKFRSMGIERIFLSPVCGKEIDFAMTKEDAENWRAQFTRLVWNILKRGELNDIKALPQIFDFLFNLEYGIQGKRSCGMGKNSCTVDVDGRRYICHRFIPRSEFEIDPQTQECSHLGIKEYLSCLEDNSHPCNMCWAKNICGSGVCPHINEMWTGSVATPYGPICDVQRQIIELACWAYYKLRKSGRIKDLLGNEL